VLEEQVLDVKCHDRPLFKSGVTQLDEYLKRFASQQSRKNIATVRVLVNTDNPHIILGYYSLSAAQLEGSQMGDATHKQLPRYPVPCFRLGRLATHINHRNLGLGRILMACAVERCLEAKKHVASYALIADAKDLNAKGFYEHYGFTACRDKPMTLYLALGLD
jgi:predicted GNAT family N-acyltransferase